MQIAFLHRANSCLCLWFLCALSSRGYPDEYEIVRKFEVRASNSLALCAGKDILIASGIQIELTAGVITLETPARGVLRFDMGGGFSSDCDRLAFIGHTFDGFTPIHLKVQVEEGYINMGFLAFIPHAVLGQVDRFDETGFAFSPISADEFFVAGFDGLGAGPVIIHFGPETTVLSTMALEPSGVVQTAGLDVDPGTLDFFLTDPVQNAIFRISREGVLIQRIDLGAFGIASAVGIAFNPMNGHLFVSDISDHDHRMVVELGPVGENASEFWVLYE